MKYCISGSSGSIGSRLIEELRSKNHDVIKLVRSPEIARKEGHIYWNPQNKEIESDKLEGLDVIIHLGGQNVAGGLWTSSYKKKIYDSRVVSTNFLVDTLEQLQSPPSVFLCASAIGVYGNAKDTLLDETSPIGTTFLSDVCRDWEIASNRAKALNIRVMQARIGLVLDKSHGILARMLLPFRLGLGGPLGDGQQYMSWISRTDVSRAIAFLTEHPDTEGPYNLVSPHPVTNQSFTKTLGKALGRPAFFRVPAFFLRLVAKEMSENMMLASTRVAPRRLESLGFSWHDPDLNPFLTTMLS